MSNILYITTSIRSADESISRGLGRDLVQRLAAGPDTKVTTRDLSANDIPYVSAERFAANLTPAAQRTPEQAELAAYADELISELQAADTIVIASPVYNFSVPATLKAWADLVARAGTTFKYTETGPEGLLAGRRAYIAIASGGTPLGSEIDFMSSWLEHFLGFLGIEVVETVAADGLMGPDAEAKVAAAREKIAKITV